MNWKYLFLGALFTVPLLYFLGRGFEFDPHRIDAPIIGRTAPVVTLPVLGGGERSVTSNTQPVILNFWATWCVPCREEYPLLKEAAKRYGDKVQFLGVVYQDTEAAIQKLLGPGGAPYPTLIDTGSRTAIAYGVSGVPETFFITRSGVVLDKYSGPLPADYLVSMIEKLLESS